MVINATYFVGPLAIAQISQAAVQGTVNDYIELHGVEFLSKALGQSLANAYLLGIDVGSDEVIEDRWEFLKQGGSFTNNSGLGRKWVGFDSGELFPLNPVAAYVWFHLQRDKAIQMAGIGAVVAEAENAQRMAPAQPLSMAWNHMSKAIYTLHEYLRANESLYPELVWSEINTRSLKPINAFGI